MAQLKDGEVRVQVLIDEDTPYGKFRDAVYYSPSEFDAISDEDILLVKTARKEKFEQEMEARQHIIEREPTIEELQKEKEDIEANLARVEASILSKIESSDEVNP